MSMSIDPNCAAGIDCEGCDCSVYCGQRDSEQMLGQQIAAKYDAYAAGSKANENGLLESACPFGKYDARSRMLRNEWLQGWMEFQETVRAEWEDSHDYAV